MGDFTRLAGTLEFSEVNHELRAPVGRCGDPAANVERGPHLAALRSLPRSTFPRWVRGRSSMKWITRGYLWGANVPFT